VLPKPAVATEATEALISWIHCHYSNGDSGIVYTLTRQVSAWHCMGCVQSTSFTGLCVQSCFVLQPTQPVPCLNLPYLALPCSPNSKESELLAVELTTAGIVSVFYHADMEPASRQQVRRCSGLWCRCTSITSRMLWCAMNLGRYSIQLASYMLVSSA
jgi:hypothetical protein